MYRSSTSSSSSSPSSDGGAGCVRNVQQTHTPNRRKCKTYKTSFARSQIASSEGTSTYLKCMACYRHQGSDSPCIVMEVSGFSIHNTHTNGTHVMGVCVRVCVYGRRRKSMKLLPAFYPASSPSACSSFSLFNQLKKKNVETGIAGHASQTQNDRKVCC